MNARLGFQPSQYGKWKFQLTGQNLLDAQRISFEHTSNLVVNRDVYDLVPLMVYLTVNYSIGAGG